MKMNRSKQKIQEDKINTQLYDQYSYMFDKNLSPYDILARYINEQENAVLVTGDQIKQLVEEI